MSPRYFATASRGTEEVLASELAGLGIAPVEVDRGGVAFGRRLDDAYRACLWSRVASRILLPLTTFDAETADAFYEGVHAIDWNAHLGGSSTLAVVSAGGRAPAGPPHFLVLKTKDAIVDKVRAAEGSRPNVDKQRPDLRVHLHLRGPRATVSLDLAGRGLHRRGLDRAAAVAPLRENLAAAIVRLTGWRPEQPLLDPMCGSGTLLLEAAGMALDVAPGLGRGAPAFERWRGHDAELWQRLRREAVDRRRAAADRSLAVYGSDASHEAVALARKLVDDAGLGNAVRIERCELRDAGPPGERPGVVLTNPPYGERLGEAGDLGPLYELLGDVLKRRFAGSTAWILSGNRALEKRLGLRPASRRILHNGPIECRLLELPIAETPVQVRGGPGWRKRTSEEAAGFAKRLRANRRRLHRWASRQDVTCYRLYDADVPTFNVAVDWYDGAARVEEHRRPAKVAPEVADRRLREAVRTVAEVLGLDARDVILRVRPRLERGAQHGRYGDRRQFREVREHGLRFLVNLEDYLDTGLFLHDRLLRRWIRGRAEGRTFLNLFAYTCSATVAAAVGGARSSVSVDLSKRYLAWGRKNLTLNGVDRPEHATVRADALRWLEERSRTERWDLVFVAPPTTSRSKAMEGSFVLQDDHGRLLRHAARGLALDGSILFATHRREFELAVPRGLTADELTDTVVPKDFERRPRLRAWELRRT